MNCFSTASTSGTLDSQSFEAADRARRMPSSAAEDWDTWVGSNPQGFHEQTSAYGGIREQYGYRSDRLLVSSGSEFVGGAQILTQRTPVGRCACIWRGPLAEGDNENAMATVVRSLDAFALEHRYAWIRVDTLPTQSVAREALQSAGYRISETCESPRRSLVVPLAHSDEVLLSRMRKKTRYNMRVAQRAGVHAAADSSMSLEDFYGLYVQSSKHQTFVPYPLTYFEHVLGVFGAAAKAMICCATLRGRTVAALISVLAGGRVYPSWIGMNREILAENLQVAGLMHYETMRWGRDRGCDLLDFQDAMSYKRMFAKDEITWPLPMRKFFGPARALRRALHQRTLSNARLKRAVTSVAHRLGLHPRMPY